MGYNDAPPEHLHKHHIAWFANWLSEDGYEMHYVQKEVRRNNGGPGIPPSGGLDEPPILIGTIVLVSELWMFLCRCMCMHACMHACVLMACSRASFLAFP